ncbi:hypothetical protein MMC07_009171 [Pseudocyphellaria aurata]|nr:hypothetical protein [Pseudocyphellaria aurata]
MGSAFLDWPSGGPTNWLGKWEKLINQANQYDEPPRTWLRDVCLVWKRVSDLTVFFVNVKDKMQENNANDYTHTTISTKIQYYWELKKQGSALCLVNKPKATRSAFASEEVTLDGDEADNLDSDGIKSKRGKKRKNESSGQALSNKRQIPSSRSAKPSKTQKTNESRKRSKGLCSACGGQSHTFSRCYLVLERKKDWILQEVQDTFTSNMKAPTFRKKVEDFRKARSTMDKLADE